MSTPVLACEQLSKRYGAGELAETVLAGVDFELRAGEACVLIGPSGSGKTTLLSILGCLLTPSSGSLRLAEESVPFDKPERLRTLRRETLGFVFQHAQLLPFLSAEENVALVGQNAGLSRSTAQSRTRELFVRLGIDAMGAKAPGQLSGGQRQRVAIARALVHHPPVVLADEPTAALDWHNGEAVADLLVELTRTEGAALVAVTHDRRLIGKFDRVLKLADGRLTEAESKEAHAI